MIALDDSSTSYDRSKILTLGGIYAAIAYYYANKELLDAEFAAYEEECDHLKAEYLAGRRS